MLLPKRSIVVCALLLLAFITLGVMTAMQGPRIRWAAFEPARLTSMPGQTITLHTNQPLAFIESAQIKLEPDIPFKVATNGTAIVMTFQERLQYDTAYTIRITGLQNTKNGPKSDVSYTLATNDATIYTIKRQDNQTDRLVAIRVGHDTEETIYQHTAIKAFAKLDEWLILNLKENDKQDRLLAIHRTAKTIRTLNPPDIGTIDQLQASPSGKIFGYRFTGGGYENDLFIHDFAANTTSTVENADGKAMPALFWEFAPDGVAVLVQTYDSITYNGMTFLADTTRASRPIPLGSLVWPMGISPTGKYVALSEHERPVLLNIKERTYTDLPRPTMQGASAVIVGLVFLGRDDRYIERVRSWQDATDEPREHLILHERGNQRIIYETAPGEEIAALKSSPNGQYIAAGIKTGNNEFKQTEILNSDGIKIKTLHARDAIIE